jgi:hypothetical protein
MVASAIAPKGGKDITVSAEKFGRLFRPATSFALQLESVPYSSETNTLRIRVLNARTKICWLRCSSASLLRTCRSLVGCAASLFHVF